MSEDKFASPASIVRAVIDLAVESAMNPDLPPDVSAKRLRELYADPTRVTHPLKPDLSPLVHHEDFIRHAAAVAQGRPQPTSFRAVDILTHATSEPEVVVTEFKYEMTINAALLSMPCIWVTRVRNGRIIEARDYNGNPSPVTSR